MLSHVVKATSIEQQKVLDRVVYMQVRRKCADFVTQSSYGLYLKRCLTAPQLDPY